MGRKQIRMNIRTKTHDKDGKDENEEEGEGKVKKEYYIDFKGEIIFLNVYDRHEYETK